MTEPFTIPPSRHSVGAHVTADGQAGRIIGKVFDKTVSDEWLYTITWDDGKTTNRHFCSQIESTK